MNLKEKIQTEESNLEKLKAAYEEREQQILKLRQEIEQIEKEYIFHKGALQTYTELLEEVEESAVKTAE